MEYNSECKNCAASAECFTLIALRANISDSNSSQYTFRTPALAILIRSAFLLSLEPEKVHLIALDLLLVLEWTHRVSRIANQMGPPFLIIRIRVIFGHRQDIQKPDKVAAKFGNRIVPLCSPAGFFFSALGAFSAQIFSFFFGHGKALPHY
jgi:hypothetical protein